MRREICGILLVAGHKIREEAAELKDRSMSFSTKQAQLRPFKAALDRLRKGNLSREGLVVVGVQRISVRSYAARIHMRNLLKIVCAHVTSRSKSRNGSW